MENILYSILIANNWSVSLNWNYCFIIIVFGIKMQEIKEHTNLVVLNIFG